MIPLRICSDLHLEFDYNDNHIFDLPVISSEDQQVLILAGDIGLASISETWEPFVRQMAERFRSVIYIMGNHEFYYGSFIDGLSDIRSCVSDLLNVIVADNHIVEFEDLSIMLMTLWTNFNNLCPLTIERCRLGMNDYRKIWFDDLHERKLAPDDVLSVHLKSVRWFREQAAIIKGSGRKFVVVSHHLPTFASIDQQHQDHYANGAYASNLDSDIIEYQPLVWIHGHTHTSNDYLADKTRIISNPRGYYQYEENPHFDPTLVVEV